MLHVLFNGAIVESASQGKWARLAGFRRGLFGFRHCSACHGVREREHVTDRIGITEVFGGNCGRFWGCGDAFDGKGASFCGILARNSIELNLHWI
jgi:hypothetical protein